MSNVKSPKKKHRQAHDDQQDDGADYVLGYWDIRGLAQPVRTLLEYLQLPYEDVRYGGQRNWPNEKFDLGLAFPNLPYLFVNDHRQPANSFKITQSNAILRYLAETHGLLGHNARERAEINMIVDTINDFRMSFARVAYNPHFGTNLKEEFLHGAFTTHLNLYEKYLGDRKWFYGSSITLADFVAFEVIDCLFDLTPESFGNHKKILEFRDHFLALPTIASYVKSDRFKSRPINGQSAKWNN